MQALPCVRYPIIRAFALFAVISAINLFRLEAAESPQTQKIVTAANAFLGTLDDTQRSKVSFDFNDAAQRKRWSNLPVNMVERRGLRTGDLKPNQLDALMNILAVVLSKMGYEKVIGIVDSDEALKREGRSGGPPFGRDEFYVSFLGKPSLTEPWIIQYGGHHLALNITIAGQQGVLTPSLIAVQPAKFTLDGKAYRPMGRETDKALELVKALTDEQRKSAILGSQMRDLVLGPGHDGETIQPEGIKASALDDAQRKLMLELIAEWSGIIHDSAAAEKMKEIKANLADTWFAYSGPLEAGKAYFRVQGPTIIIEFAPQRSEMHLHSMYRDPTNDYGKKLVGK